MTIKITEEMRRVAESHLRWRGEAATAALLRRAADHIERIEEAHEYDRKRLLRLTEAR